MLCAYLAPFQSLCARPTPHTSSIPCTGCFAPSRRWLTPCALRLLVNSERGPTFTAFYDSPIAKPICEPIDRAIRRPIAKTIETNSKVHSPLRGSVADPTGRPNLPGERPVRLSGFRLETRLVRFHLTRTQAVRSYASHPGFALNGLHQGRPVKFGLGAISPHPPRGLG